MYGWFREMGKIVCYGQDVRKVDARSPASAFCRRQTGGWRQYESEADAGSARACSNASDTCR